MSFNILEFLIKAIAYQTFDGINKRLKKDPGVKKIGIVGGMGSVAAAYFFKRLVELTPAETDQQYIETVLHNNTRVPDRTRNLLYGEESPLPELKRSISLLNGAEVDYIILACLTSHYYISALQQESRAQIINAVKQAVEHVSINYPRVERVGILASTGAIKTGLFQQALSRSGFESVVLSEVDQHVFFMEPIYAPWGIKAGYSKGQPQERLSRGIDSLVKSGAQVVIAGCSELPIVLNQIHTAVPLIDSIDVLLVSAIERCVDMNESKDFTSSIQDVVITIMSESQGIKV